MRCRKAVVGGISKLGMMQTEGNVALELFPWTKCVY